MPRDVSREPKDYPQSKGSWHVEQTCCGDVPVPKGFQIRKFRPTLRESNDYGSISLMSVMDSTVFITGNDFFG